MVAIFLILLMFTFPLIHSYECEISKFIDYQFNNVTHKDKYNYNLSISKINGGFGIKVTIENQDEIEIKNISIKISQSNGNNIIIKNQTYYIPILKPYQSYKIIVSAFGVGLGYIRDYPEFNIILRSQNIQLQNLYFSARILGTFVIIKNIMNYSSDAYDGYTLFSPMISRNTYLIGMNGNILHSWQSNYPSALSVYLQPNGNIIRATNKFYNENFIIGGYGGIIEIINWNNTQIWEYKYSTEEYCLHHDIELLPNGNILMIAGEIKTIDELMDAGRHSNHCTNKLVFDYLIEVKPVNRTYGIIVWEWHVWDHLIQDFDKTMNNYGIISDHPELIDINYDEFFEFDFSHINSIDYNPEFDQILLSAHNFNEIWIIDHSTTTDEAKGHIGGRCGKGGDLLYRWGNPRTYHHGDFDNQVFFRQHDARWIEEGFPGEGNILVFNNLNRESNSFFSSVDEFSPPVDTTGNYYRLQNTKFGPDSCIWSYTAEDKQDFISINLAGAQRLKNGNTLICEGTKGRFFEVSVDKNILWEYINPYPSQLINHVFKISRYEYDFLSIN